MEALGIEQPVAEGLPRASEREATALLERLLEHLTDGLFAVDRIGRVIYWSPSMERLAGRRAGEAMGRPAAALIGSFAAGILDPAPPHGRPGRPRPAQSPLNGEASASGFIEGPAGPIPVRMTAVTASGPGEAFIARVCAVTDLSRAWRSRAEEERQASLAALGQAAATIAHQLRNPLGAALGFIDLARLEAGPGAASEYLSQARQGLLEIEQRIAGLMQFVRVRPLQLERVDLTALLASLAAEFQARYPRGPGCRVELPPRVRVTADPGQLRQAVENLLANAAEEAGTAGRVELILQVEAHREREGVRLLVRNTGREIPASDLERIFEPFVTGKKEGTGLGLPLVRRIVAAHRGRITALSAGGWTTFVMRLPADAAAVEECHADAA
ncbi:MAG: ATP-binding protein [Candidatus Eisenbacteria bacterium]